MREIVGLSRPPFRGAATEEGAGGAGGGPRTRPPLPGDLLGVAGQRRFRTVGR